MNMYSDMWCSVFAFILLVGSSISAKDVPFMYCSSGNTLITLVIHPCVPPTPEHRAACLFRHGTKVRVDAAFIAPHSSGNLETISTSIFKGREIPFPDSGSNPCQENISPGCPVTKGNLYILTFHFDVLKYYPTGPMDIKVSIRDKKTKQVFACAKVSVVIRKNPDMSYI